MDRACRLAALALLAAFPLAAQPRFRDVAASSGLLFVLENSPTPQKHLIETMPGGVAAFDYDNDGLTDIFFTNGAVVPSLEKNAPKYWNRLYRNEGAMKFRDVTAEAGVAGAGYSMGVATGDYDNDGRVDLFIAGVYRNLLYRNLGNGKFEDVTARAGIGGGSWSVAAGWFDYDGDGRLDLFVVNYTNWTAKFDRYCGDAARQIRVYCHPRFFDTVASRLYRNRGDGSFEDVSTRTGIAAHRGRGMSVAFADYDADGRPDAFVTNDALPNFLFRNLGDGRFEEAGLTAGVALLDTGKPVSSMGADFRDYDNDGWPDLSITALAARPSRCSATWEKDCFATPPMPAGWARSASAAAAGATGFTTSTTTAARTCSQPTPTSTTTSRRSRPASTSCPTAFCRTRATASFATPPRASPPPARIAAAPSPISTTTAASISS